jgi:subfamily B ATP-binding cassette protein MsbA
MIENLRIQTLFNLRNAVMNNIMTLDLAYFNNERKGNIIAKMASDIYIVQYSVTSTLQVIFKEPLTLLAYLVMLFVISYKLTLISILVLPLSAFLISRIVKGLKKQSSDSQKLHGLMISYLDEALIGIRVVKAFNAVKFVTGRFQKENKQLSSLTRAMARRQQLASPVSEFMGVMMVAAIVLYGGSLVLSKDSGSDLTGPAFIAYIALFSQILRPAKAISDSFASIHQGVAAGERMLSLVDEMPAIADAEDAIDINEFKDRIRFHHVSFGYSERIVLRDISFEIQRGQTIAVVGPSGGGKSTLMDLLPKFIQPQQGSIEMDGRDIKSITAVSLRSLMGIVNQDPILFNDSIFNNIAFGREGVTMEEVTQAAITANAHDFISAMEKGYDTQIGDRGVLLSGGQRQRICLARAVLGNPPIMLLDEATSSLDTESEKIVQDALTNLMRHRTSLVIAHRLSTIQNADHIIVLEAGRIVEQGTHRELIARQGLYKRLIDMQTFYSE